MGPKPDVGIPRPVPVPLEAVAPTVLPDVQQQPEPSDGADSTEAASEDVGVGQAEKVNSLAVSVLNAKIGEVRSGIVALQETDPKKAGQVALEPGNNAVHLLGRFQDLQDGDSWVFEEGTSLQVGRGDDAVSVTEVVGVEGDNFTCTVEGQESVATFSRQQILDAQLLEQEAEILGQFPAGTPERELLEIHVKTLRGEEDAFANKDAVDKVISDTEKRIQDKEQKAAQIPAEDRIITAQVTQLETQIKEAKRGEDVSKKQRLLATLRLAAEANGEIGVLFKARALHELQAAGVTDPQMAEAIQNMDSRVPVAEAALAIKLGLTPEQINAIKAAKGEEGLEKILTSGLVSKVEGLEELVFGRKLEKGELDKLLTPEQKKLLEGKGGGILMLLMYIIGGGPNLIIDMATQK